MVKFLTGRAMSISLIFLLIALLYLSTVVPQERDAAPAALAAWRLAHPVFSRAADLMQLHRIYVQPWFALPILLAALSLTLSCARQFRAALRRLSSTDAAANEEIASSCGSESLSAAARSLRYRQAATAAGRVKYVRNRLGFFGSPLMHAGMVLAIGASCWLALTGRQAVMILAEGESRDGRIGWSASESGLFSPPLEFPGAIGLEKVTVSFDERQQPSRIASVLAFTGKDGSTERFEAGINRLAAFRGTRVYHSSQYGDAFAVEFVDRQGTVRYEKLPLQQAAGPDRAGYADFTPPWLPYELSAKYYADAEKKRMTGGDPLLTMRLMDGEREAARAELSTGRAAHLGPYRVRLIGVQKWAKIIFVDLTGMEVVFAGFAVIMLGGLFQYLAPPRELVGVAGEDGRYRVYWRGGSFGEFYLEERDRLKAALEGEGA